MSAEAADDMTPYAGMSAEEAVAAAGTLDEAWAAAEAALPEGWTVASVEGYVADKREWKFGKGDTPAAALHALAAALRGVPA